MEEFVLGFKKQLIIDVFNYFTSEATNISYFEDIKEFALNDPLAQLNPNFEIIISSGYLSTGYFSHYSIIRRKTGYPRKTGSPNGIPVETVDRILRILEKNHILTTTNNFNVNSREKYYKVCAPIALMYKNEHTLLSKVLGFQYIIDTYKKSVFKIETIINDEIGIGNAFYCEHLGKKFLITNEHVVGNDESKIKVFDLDNKQYHFRKIHVSKKYDLAIILIDSIEKDVIPFTLSKRLILLSEILTIGYPPIPFTKDSYIIFHKGEINSIVTTYDNRDFFVFSAKTNPGNSGGPVIDEMGMVVGIITQQLEERDWYKKSKLPYYVATPSLIIINCIESVWDEL